MSFRVEKQKIALKGFFFVRKEKPKKRRRKKEENSNSRIIAFLFGEIDTSLHNIVLDFSKFNSFYLKKIGKMPKLF